MGGSRAPGQRGKGTSLSVLITSLVTAAAPAAVAWSLMKLAGAAHWESGLLWPRRALAWQCVPPPARQLKVTRGQTKATGNDAS